MTTEKKPESVSLFGKKPVEEKPAPAPQSKPQEVKETKTQISVETTEKVTEKPSLFGITQTTPKTLFGTNLVSTTKEAPKSQPGLFGNTKKTVNLFGKSSLPEPAAKVDAKPAEEKPEAKVEQKTGAEEKPAAEQKTEPKKLGLFSTTLKTTPSTGKF